MKAINLKLIFPFLVLLLLSKVSFSQWEEEQLNVRFSVPEITLIDIEPAFNNSINFTISPKSGSGSSPSVTETTNESLWINYSSALSNTNKSRSILAEISEGTLPSGISIYLEASPYSGRGRGQVGQPTGKITLSNSPRSIITNIGSCFTGDGTNNGHSLSFSIEISDYSKINSMDETTFTILYTISDN